MIGVSLPLRPPVAAHRSPKVANGIHASFIERDNTQPVVDFHPVAPFA